MDLAAVLLHVLHVEQELVELTEPDSVLDLEGAAPDVFYQGLSGSTQGLVFLCQREELVEGYVHG